MQLKVCHWNIENLFLYISKYRGEDLSSFTELQWERLSSSSVKNKSLSATRAAARVIKDIDPDILCLNEVGGVESLENFNQYFLDNQYSCYLIEANSDRGIDVGYLVKKTLPFSYLHISHKDRVIPLKYPADKANQKYYFSRDISELRLIEPQTSKIKAVFLITHLKSKLDPHGIDFEGITRRQAETKSLMDLYNQLNNEFNKQTPIIVAGDFNGLAHPSECATEFTSIYQDTDLRDYMDILKFDDESRTTKVQFSRTDSPRHIQIDYIFLSPHWRENIDADNSYVYRFKNKKGEAQPLPQVREERYLFPSDHYPLVLSFKALPTED